jgi:hypothetical protein
VSAANPSFETAGATPGDAASWTLSVTAATSWATFARADGGVTRFEGFELSWGQTIGYEDPALFTTMDPAFAQRDVFNAPTLPPEFADGFEKHWLNDGFLFSLPLAAAAEFANHPSASPPSPTVDPFDGFETEWANSVFFRSLADVTTDEALFFNFDLSMPEPYEDFEWLNPLPGGGFVQMMFTEAGASWSAETFEGFKPDQPFIMTPPSTITAPAHGYTNGQQIKVFASIYDPQTVLPRGLSPKLTYTVAAATANTLELTLGGSTVVVSDAGSGTNYLRVDPAFSWGGLDGDTMAQDP